MTVSPFVTMRRLAKALPGAALPAQTSSVTWARGVVAGVGQNGTVNVTLNGSTVDIPAYTLASYSNPQVGDRVEVRKEDGFAVVHGVYTVSQPPTLTPSENQVASTPIFVNAPGSAGSLVGSLWPTGAPLTWSPLDVPLTTNGSGQWTFSFANSWVYTYGYVLFVTAGGTGQGDCNPEIDSCTLSTVTGISYALDGSTNNNASIVVAGQAIGA